MMAQPGFAGTLIDLLQQRKAEQMAAQHRQDILAQQATQNDYQNRALQQQENLRQDALKETARLHNFENQNNAQNYALKLGDVVPADQFIEKASPAVGPLQSVGMLKTAPARPAMGQDFVGPMPGGETPQEAQVGRPEGFIKTASFKQQQDEATRQEKAAEEQRKMAADANTAQYQQGMVGAANRRADAAMRAANRPAASGDKLMQVKTLDENGDPVTQYMTPAQITAQGGTFKSQRSAVTQNRVDSANAVMATGRQIQSQLADPQVAASIGPAMGRYTSLRDFIGNPPPEFSKLAGEIESFALANMGVHGMRSAQGAEKIKTLLDAHHTPESLNQAIEGLLGFSNNFVKGAGATPQGGPAPATKPTAADLIKKYGG